MKIEGELCMLFGSFASSHWAAGDIQRVRERREREGEGERERRKDMTNLFRTRMSECQFCTNCFQITNKISRL